MKNITRLNKFPFALPKDDTPCAKNFVQLTPLMSTRIFIYYIQ